VAVHRLIEESHAVISMPFTSTALIGRELNKPSIYYDSLGFIGKNEPAAHGIEVISGKNELREWMNSYYKLAS